MRYFSAVSLLIIAVLWYAGLFYFDSYNKAPWYYDLMMHFLGGFWLAIAAITYLKIEKSFISIFGAVALAGVFWEFYEYSVSRFAGLAADPGADILSDLFMDLLGGAVFLLIYKVKTLMPFWSKK